MADLYLHMRVPRANVTSKKVAAGGAEVVIVDDPDMDEEPRTLITWYSIRCISQEQFFESIRVNTGGCPERILRLDRPRADTSTAHGRSPCKGDMGHNNNFDVYRTRSQDPILRKDDHLHVFTYRCKLARK